MCIPSCMIEAYQNKSPGTRSKIIIHMVHVPKKNSLLIKHAKEMQTKINTFVVTVYYILYLCSLTPSPLLDLCYGYHVDMITNYKVDSEKLSHRVFPSKMYYIVKFTVILMTILYGANVI